MRARQDGRKRRVAIVCAGGDQLAPPYARRTAPAPQTGGLAAAGGIAQLGDREICAVARTSIWRELRVCESANCKSALLCFDCLPSGRLSLRVSPWAALFASLKRRRLQRPKRRKRKKSKREGEKEAQNNFCRAAQNDAPRTARGALRLACNRFRRRATAEAARRGEEDERTASSQKRRYTQAASNLNSKRRGKCQKSRSLFTSRAFFAFARKGSAKARAAPSA